MTERDNLTAKQNDYAVFLPALSGFYATFIGKQRNPDGPYVDPARFPNGLTDMEQLNWLNSKDGLFPYKWSLYSGGHANLDVNKEDWSEDMVRNREEGAFILGDSGGFQIGKGVWEGDWKNPNCPKAAKKRDQVLRWMDKYMDYGMVLDIPAWVSRSPRGQEATGITSYQEAVDATRINNDYWIANRTGACKFLNVLQGENHTQADDWYEQMKDYCDPVKYPGKHFNGWAMGGQNMCDVHLVLRRLVELRHDNLLQEGVHDWMHFLGTSKLEWAVLLTVIQRAIRKYVNPSFTISFDCASPFLATANGQVYYENVYPHDDKWSYRMGPSADDKKYATDTRKWSDGVIADGIYPSWLESPVSDMLQMKDICIYKPGDLNKVGKEGKTSWDSFSYALLMAHNVWMHLTAVQEANRRFDAGEHPAMMRNSNGDYAFFEEIVERIFATSDKQEAIDIIEEYDLYWMDIVGTRGFKGKKTKNSHTMFGALFEETE